MPLTREQFAALRAKGLTPEQIARFEKRGTAKAKPAADPWSVPHAPYSGAPNLPLQDPGLLDPLNYVPGALGTRAAVGLAGAGARATGRAVASGAATPVLRHVGTAGGAAVGGMIGGPGGAAAGGFIGRQILTPATVAKFLERFAKPVPPPAPPPAALAEALGSSINWIR